MSYIMSIAFALVLLFSGISQGSRNFGAPLGGQSPVLPLGGDRPETPGITRTTLRDDAKSMVTRVHFEPGAAEPPHTHAVDVILVVVEQAGQAGCRGSKNHDCKGGRRSLRAVQHLPLRSQQRNSAV